MKSLIIWFNPRKKIYYYRVINNFISNYYEGYINQYGHIVVLVIDIYKDLIYKEPLRNKVIRKFISFLHKLEKK